MNKRFLFFASVFLAAGSLVIFVLYYKHSDKNTRVTDQDLIKAREAIDGKVHSENTAAPAPLDPSHPVRLAVGGLGLAEEESNRRVGDLIVAELTGVRGLDLVERQSLDKVLREMSLSLSGLVRAKDAVRVGKLLRVDWFLLGTMSSSSGKKAVVARIVDAHSGIMRDVTVIKQDNDPARLARELAQFVRQCRQTAAKPKPRVFLAVGAFTDVSVNNRLADLPSQLRSGLTAAYQGGDVTLLEREYVNTLLQEVRLDLAGLTEGGPANPPAMQSAMWLVDGYYQSFETTDMQVDLILRINRIFGRTAVVTLRAPPGEALVRQMKESIDQVLAKASPSVMVPTRRSEIKFQMNIGKDLVNAGVVQSVSLFLRHNVGFGRGGRNNSKDVRNLEEAIRAFETVLLLDPENSEAKIYLAACLRTDLIGRTEEAQNYYREVIAMPVKDHWTTTAMLALAGTYRWSDPQEAAKWFREAGAFEEEKQVLERVRSTDDMDEKRMKSAEERLFEGTRAADQGLKTRTGTLNAGSGMMEFVKYFGTNETEAASRLAVLMPKLNETFPDIVPHLLLAAVQFQVDTNASVIAEFRRSLKTCVEHPEAVTNSKTYFDYLLRDAYDWCMDNKQYSLAVELGEAKRRAAAKGFTSPLGERDKVKLGFAYRDLERWKDAMEVFESLNNKPIDTYWSGARWKDPFLPSKAVEECRAQLGLPAIKDPLQFDFGAVCLHLHDDSPLVEDGRPSTNRFDTKIGYSYDRSSFTVEGSDLWAARDKTLFRLDLAFKTNLSVTLPKKAGTYINALSIGPETIWIGTEGEGLIEYNKASGKCRFLTVKDGLLLNEVSCLHLQDQSLWIGYGPRVGGANYVAGGLGVMELQSHRLSSFTPPLSTQGAEVINNPADGPPRSHVFGIASRKPNELWLVAHGKGLQQHRISENIWATLPRGPSDPNCLAANSDHLFVGLDNGGVVIRNLQDGQVHGLGVEQGLPVPQVSALAVDGPDLWIGGRGYVAVADIKQNKVRKVSYVQTRSVDRIQVAGGYVWVQFDGHLYRASLKDLR